MDSLIAGVLDGFGLPASLAGNGTAYAPSAPVQIGTPGAHHRISEAGALQMLILMFAVVVGLGTAVLLSAVRQRMGVMARRRVRRMAEAVDTALGHRAVAPHVTGPHPTAHLPPHSSRRTPHAERPHHERVP